MPHLLNIARAALLKSVCEQAAVRHSRVKQLLLPQQQAPSKRVQGAGAARSKALRLPVTRALTGTSNSPSFSVPCSSSLRSANT